MYYEALIKVKTTVNKISFYLQSTYHSRCSTYQSRCSTYQSRCSTYQSRCSIYQSRYRN